MATMLNHRNVNRDKDHLCRSMATVAGLSEIGKGTSKTWTAFGPDGIGNCD
jgi:hypothetical protein